MINGEKWEIKTLFTPSKSAVNDAMRRAKGQSKKLILHDSIGVSDDLLKRGMKGVIKMTELEKVIVIKANYDVIEMDRKEIINW